MKNCYFATFSFFLILKMDTKVCDIFKLNSSVATQVPENLMVFVFNALKEEHDLKAHEVCVCIVEFGMQKCLSILLRYLIILKETPPHN